MPGTKRTHSFAFPEEDRSLKLVKRKSSIKVSASAPVDAGSRMPPAIRRASTMSVEDETMPDSESGYSTLKPRRSSRNKPASLTKKSSSFVEKGVLVTKLSGLRSGSVVGETSLTSSISATKKASLTKSKSVLSKSESIRVTAVDETELSTAVSGVKSHLFKGESKLSKKASVVSVSSISALTKLTTVKSSSGKDDKEKMDTARASTSNDHADTLQLPPGGLLEVVVSFDTTGSMYGCLEEVRAKVQDLVQRLQADIPGIKIAIIAHGDYCDASNYIVRWLDFGAILPEICGFVKTVSRTYGGDGPECYELVLRRACDVLSWTPGSQRILIMIGDDEPHPVGYTYGGETYNIDWRKECQALKNMNVKVYGVQAGNRFGAGVFYDEMARITGGCRLHLRNFSSIFDFLMMICYREANPEMIATYQQEILDREGYIAADVTEMTRAFGSELSGAPAVPSLPFGMTGAPTVPSPPFGMIGAPSVPYPFVTSRTPTVHSPPFGMTGAPALTSPPFGMKEAPAAPLPPFGMIGAPAAPSPPFGMKEAPAVPSPPFGMIGAPAVPSPPFGMIGAPAAPSPPFGMIGAPSVPSLHFGMIGAPAAPSPPFGMIGAPAAPSPPFGMIGAPASTFPHFGIHPSPFKTPGVPSSHNIMPPFGSLHVPFLPTPPFATTKAPASHMHKATNRKTKKNSALRKDNVKKRERLTDACMKKGPLKDLKWTKWECAVVPCMPTNRLRSKYSKLRTNNGYGPKKIFDDTFTEPAIYEVAVQLPGYRKKYTTYMMKKKGFRRVMHWASQPFKNKKIRAEVNYVLAQGCSIYIRRASLAPQGFPVTQKMYTSFISQNYDYAWKKYKRRQTAALKSFELKKRCADVSRGGKTYTLSSGDL